MDIKKLLKKSSIAKNIGTSVTIISVCFRIIKQRYNITELDGHIRHNILFLKDTPREVSMQVFRDKKELLGAINAELLKFDFRYKVKDIITR